MKNKIYVSLMILTTLSFAHAEENLLRVKNQRFQDGKTIVTFSREFISNGTAYQLGYMDRAFNGQLTSEQLATKGTLFVPEGITVICDSFKKEGQLNILDGIRSTAFLKGGINAYLTELNKQIENEK